MRGKVSRLELQDFLKMLDGFVRFTQCGESDTQALVGFGEIRPELQGILKMFDSFVRFTQCDESNTQALVGFGEIRLELHGILKILNRQVRFFCLLNAIPRAL